MNFSTDSPTASLSQAPDTSSDIPVSTSFTVSTEVSSSVTPSVTTTTQTRMAPGPPTMQPSSAPQVSTIAIAGGSIGGFAAIATLAEALLLYWRRRRIHPVVEDERILKTTSGKTVVDSSDQKTVDGSKWPF